MYESENETMDNVTIERLREEHPDLIGQLHEEWAASQTAEKDLVKLQEENRKLKLAIAEHEATEKARQVRESVADMVKDLPKDVADESFVESLVKMDSDDDRKHLLETVTKALKLSSKTSPQSDAKTEDVKESDKGASLDDTASAIRRR